MSHVGDLACCSGVVLWESICRILALGWEGRALGHGRPGKEDKVHLAVPGGCRAWIATVYMPALRLRVLNLEQSLLAHFVAVSAVVAVAAAVAVAYAAAAYQQVVSVF